jgi:hypothetical protein
MAHHLTHLAGVAELADALDLGSSVFMTWGFKSLHPHHYFYDNKITYFICGSSSVVEHHLAKVGVAGSNPVFRSNSKCRGGGTGRRTGLKILR